MTVRDVLPRDAIPSIDDPTFASDASLYAYENPDYEFESSGDGRIRADGTTWDPVTGESADGRTLSRLPARTLFAFAWQDDHGPDSFY